MQSAEHRPEHLSKRDMLLRGAATTVSFLLAACNVSSSEQASSLTPSPNVARPESTKKPLPTPSLAPVKQERISPTDPAGKKRYAVRFVEALSGGDIKEIAGFFYRSTWEPDIGLQNNVRALAARVKGCVPSPDDVVIRQQDGRELVTVVFKNPCSEIFSDKAKRLMLAHSIQFSLDLSVDEVRIGSTPFELIPSVVPVPTLIPRPTEIILTPTQVIRKLLVEKTIAENVLPESKNWTSRDLLKLFTGGHLLDIGIHFPNGWNFTDKSEGGWAPRGFQLIEGNSTEVFRMQNGITAKNLSWMEFWTDYIERTTINISAELQSFPHSLFKAFSEFDIKGVEQQGHTDVGRIERDGIRIEKYGSLWGSAESFRVLHPALSELGGGFFIKSFLVKFATTLDFKINIGELTYGYPLSRELTLRPVFEQITREMRFRLLGMDRREYPARNLI